jgi:hypothetical protein
VKNMIAVSYSVAIAAFISLQGCATKEPKPIAKYICVEAKQPNPQAEAYLQKKLGQYLGEYGFTLSTEKCDLNIKYEQFGAFQGESVANAIVKVSRNGYWSQEGIFNVTHNGKLISEDNQVNLRGYSTNQDLLEALAWALIYPTYSFTPYETQKK